MGKKKDTYIAGQRIENKMVIDENGNPNLIQRVVYEQREVVEGYHDIRLPKKHKYNNGGFITVFQQAMKAIAIYGDLSKSEYQLLVWLLGSAGVDGSVDTSLDAISEDLNMSKSMISRAIKALVLRNIIIRRDGNRYDRQALPMELSLNSYDQINYNLAYNGKASQFGQKHNNHPAIEVKSEEGGWVPITSGSDYKKLDAGKGLDLFTGEIHDVFNRNNETDGEQE